MSQQQRFGVRDIPIIGDIYTFVDNTTGLMPGGVTPGQSDLGQGVRNLFVPNSTGVPGGVNQPNMSLNDTFGELPIDYGQDITVEQPDLALEMPTQNAIKASTSGPDGNMSIAATQNADGGWLVATMGVDGNITKFTQDSMEGNFSGEGRPSIDLTQFVAQGYADKNGSVEIAEIPTLDAINIIESAAGGAPLPGMEKIDDLSQADFISELGFNFTKTDKNAFNNKVMAEINRANANAGGATSNPIVDQIRAGASLADLGIEAAPTAPNPIKVEDTKTVGDFFSDSTSSASTSSSSTSSPQVRELPSREMLARMYQLAMQDGMTRDEFEQALIGPPAVPVAVAGGTAAGQGYPIAVLDMLDEIIRGDDEPAEPVKSVDPFATQQKLDDLNDRIDGFDAEREQIVSDMEKQIRGDGDYGVGAEADAFDETLRVDRSEELGQAFGEYAKEQPDAFDNLIKAARELGVAEEQLQVAIQENEKKDSNFRSAIGNILGNLPQLDVVSLLKSIKGFKMAKNERLNKKDLTKLNDKLNEKREALGEAQRDFHNFQAAMYFPGSEQIDPNKVLDEFAKLDEQDVDADMARLKFQATAEKVFGGELDFDTPEQTLVTEQNQGDGSLLVSDEMMEALNPKIEEIDITVDSDEPETYTPAPRSYGVTDSLNPFNAESVQEKLQRLEQTMNPTSFGNSMGIARDRVGDMVEYPFEVLGAIPEKLGRGLRNLTADGKGKYFKQANEAGKSMMKFGDAMAGIGQTIDDFISGTSQGKNRDETEPENLDEVSGQEVLDFYNKRSGISPLTEIMRDKGYLNMAAANPYGGMLPANAVNNVKPPSALRYSNSRDGRGTNQTSSSNADSLFGSDMVQEQLTNMASGFDLSTPEGQRAYAGLYGQGALDRELGKRGLGNLLTTADAGMKADPLDLSELVTERDYETKKFGDKPKRDIIQEIADAVSESTSTTSSSNNNVLTVKPQGAAR
tara:strand:+ start:663 stop:3572 length:2910 start_codon:yes stop_codon:yes gene_type:complete